MAGYRYSSDEKAVIAEALDYYSSHLECEAAKAEGISKTEIRAKIGFAATARMKIKDAD